jgi:proline iminopeptidase
MDPQHPPGELASRAGAVPVAGAEPYYRDIGQGTPIIVLRGGPSFDHHYLLPELDRLAGRYRLIYYGQRGRGESSGDVQPEDVTLASEIADLDVARVYFRSTLRSPALLDRLIEYLGSGLDKGGRPQSASHRTPAVERNV